MHGGCYGLTAQQSSYEVEDRENGHVDLLMADQKRLIDRGVIMSPKSVGIISNITESRLVCAGQQRLRLVKDILDSHEASSSEDGHDGE